MVAENLRKNETLPEHHGLCTLTGVLKQFRKDEKTVWLFSAGVRPKISQASLHSSSSSSNSLFKQTSAVVPATENTFTKQKGYIGVPLARTEPAFATSPSAGQILGVEGSGQPAGLGSLSQDLIHLSAVLPSRVERPELMASVVADNLRRNTTLPDNTDISLTEERYDEFIGRAASEGGTIRAYGLPPVLRRIYEECDFTRE